MLCLLDSNNMGGIVDDTFVGPRFSSTETERQYNSLAKGWILGSVSEEVLADVHSLDSAKAVWEKLKSNYDPIVCQQNDSTSKKSDVEAEKEVDKVANSADTIIVGEGADSIEITVDPTETDTQKEDKQNHENKITNFDDYYMALRRATTNGYWPTVEMILKKFKFLVTKAITWDGSTILHMAVGLGHNDFIEKLCSTYITDDQVLQQRETDGSSALHIAAIVGNTHAADLLVKMNRKLLRIKDKNGMEPLNKAYENMHLDTIEFLLKAVNDDLKTESQSSLGAFVHLDDEIGVGLLVNAISAKQYSSASELVEKFPSFASKSDEVLMAIAKNFPSGLDDWETLVYPSFDDMSRIMGNVASSAFAFLLWPVVVVLEYIFMESSISTMLYQLVILTVPAWLVSPFILICLFILIVRFTFLRLYSLWWKGAKILFPPIKRIEDKKKAMEEAKRVLSLVCTEIDNSKNSGINHYTRPILEATCQNAYEVVNHILWRSPAAIKSKDKNGYDIIQLAIMNRSEKIYNLIYDIGEHKNVYRTCKDSSENNIMHLAGKLAPSSVLNRRTGAALQLQRELKWLQEVEKLVFPSFITQENISKETPYMVFTREHKDLKKEGEQWMKTTAESCSITAALIITIVFAAAITVPGGSNQEKGTPLFKNQVAFIIFAIADAISLFAS
ncbi:hypothetical protein M8C21_012740, partial [Ambrosia artemisiifolia]